MPGTSHQGAAEANEHEKKLHVDVSAPKDVKTKKFTWAPSLLVSEAAAEAAERFKYAPDAGLNLSKDKKVLDNTVSLHQAGVVDGDLLTLIAGGGGV